MFAHAASLSFKGGQSRGVCMDLFDGFSRGILEANGELRTLEQQQMPRAAFMRADAVRSSHLLAYDESKIFLGVVDGVVRRGQQIGHHEVHGGRPIGFGDDNHLVTVAQTRAGKGRTVINPTLIHYAGPAVATDPKGELANATAARRHDLGHRVFCADPFEATRGRAKKFRARFNPLSILKPGSKTMIEDAGLIADAIVIPGNTQDPHWDESARAFLEGVVLFVATDQLFEERRHLATVRDLIAGQAESAGETGMDVLAEQMRANNAADPAVHQQIMDAAEDFFTKPDDERGSVLSNTRRHLRFLSYPQIRHSVSGHDFDLSDLKTGIDGRPVTIYLCLPAMRMATCNRWLRLFVNLALAAMEAIPGKPEPPVLFCLDEFPVLGTVKSIEQAVGLLAGYGVRLWPIVQGPRATEGALLRTGGRASSAMPVPCSSSASMILKPSNGSRNASARPAWLCGTRPKYPIRTPRARAGSEPAGRFKRSHS